MKMSYISEMYKTIECDLILPIYEGKKKLSRSKVLDNSIRTIFFVDANTKTREFGIKLNMDYGREVINTLPKWKGIEISINHMYDYEDENYDCIVFQQLEQYENYIFEIIVEDIFDTLKCLREPNRTIITLINVLTKWKKFFLIQPEIKMSEIKQQGLYGELLLLEQLIKKYGEQAVHWWTGCNMETHDFYIDTNAVEVKTTSTKGPYKINISSEYQLDPMDVNGRLFLKFIALRKSETDGEHLPELIEKIKTTVMDHQGNIEEFNNKLYKYGFIKEHPELYNIGFKQREMCNYEINGQFPKIVSKDLPIGIGNITYELDLPICEQFQISEEELYNALKRCQNDN